MPTRAPGRRRGGPRPPARDAASGANLMAASLECARAEVTTGEWAGALREEFGEYRAPTGVSGSVGVSASRAGRRPGRVRDMVGAHGRGARREAAHPRRQAGPRRPQQRRRAGRRARPRRRLRGRLPGHPADTGADRRGRSRRGRAPRRALDPQRLAHGARARGAAGLREAGAGDVPVIVGGIIPESDAAALRAAGVAMVFTPKDFGLNEIMGELVGGHPARARPRRSRGRARVSRRTVRG